MKRLAALHRRLLIVAGLARRTARRVLVRLLVLAAAACVVTGIGLVFAPAALIATGVVIFALLTFDPDRAGRLTWPR